MLRAPLRLTLALAILTLLPGCPKKDDGGGGPVKPKRCEVDLAMLKVATAEGTGANAKVIAAAAELIGGQTPTGRTGDVLLQNDKVRVIIEQPGRQVGPVLYGGAIIDADLVRPAGEPGRDQFGRMAVVHALGRVVRVNNVEILADGSSGGSAIVASTGDDVPHDLFNLRSLIQANLGNVTFVIDPDKALPLRVTTYHVLSPGQSRVRILTAYCNDGTEPASFPLLDLYDFNGSVEVFNPGGCANGLGNGECLIDSSQWIGAQGNGVSYGVRSFSFADLAVPVKANATLVYGGVVGSVVEARDLAGVLSYTDPEARNRPGTFAIRAGGQKSYLRDLVIARDLAGVSAELLAIDGAATGKIEVTTQDAAGAPAPFARVAVIGADTRLVTVLETDATGKGTAVLAAATYSLSAAKEGLLIGPVTNVDVQTGATKTVTLPLSVGRMLSVQVADPSGAAIPAKVTVKCATSPCAFSEVTWKKHILLETIAGGAAAVGFVPMNGKLDLTLPPGEYDVMVSRGPEFSVWPDTWPTSGQRVDLTAANQQVSAVIGRIFDTPGWMSADLHVHAINSSDSLVPNEKRVANFLAEGVDVLVSTDHEFITDYQPIIDQLNARAEMASIMGEEVTSFSHGHFNTFPVVRDDSKGGNGGAFDHAGGEGPTLRLTELFPQVKAAFGGNGFVQINHGRGGGGALTQLKVDTATLASHANPADFRMTPAPDATATNTKLFGDGFDGLETANGPNLEFELINDWMTFLSRGTVRTATGVSDSHKLLNSSGGYSRTWLRVGVDSPAALTPEIFSEAARKNRAIITNGPFLKVTAQKTSAAGMPEGPIAEVGDTLKLSAAANEGVVLNVDVFAQDWVQFDRIELYSYAPGREAVNGEENKTWPDGRILDKKVLDSAALIVQPVPGSPTLRRLHVTHAFTQKPAKDTWFVVMVRSIGTTRTLLPMVDARPYAMSNAILIDADGSGAYDDFPLKPGQPLSSPPPLPELGPRRVPTALEFERMLRVVLETEGH